MRVVFSTRLESVVKRLRFFNLKMIVRDYPNERKISC